MRSGSTCSRGADEAHRVLGADGGGARAGVRPRLGRPVRDGRARRPHRAGGARRRGVRPRRCGARSGRPSSCRRSSDDDRRRLDPVAVQRRTIGTLVVAQAVGAVGITIGIATASLLARDISGSESQAGLAQTFQVLGAAVASFLLARLMSRRGRRVGLMTGYLLGAAGAVLAVLAGVVGSMPLLLRRRRAARLDDGRQQRRAVRRHRPRAGRAPGPRAVHGRLGDHDRRRRSGRT